MPPYGEADPDLADKLIEAERDNLVANAQSQLGQAGNADCIDCGVEIPAARRRALPSARRCVTCQSFVERGDV